MNRLSAARLPVPSLAALCVAVLLTGCSSGQWLREGASLTDIDRDLFDCEREAARMYPPSITNELRFGSTTSDNTTCTKKGDTVDCKTTTRPTYTQATDANEGRRSKAQQSCMRSKGYFWREDR